MPSGGCGEPRRQPQQIDRGEEKHDDEQRDLGEQQAAIFGPDQGRDGTGEKPGVDHATREQNRHTCHGEHRIAPGRGARDRRPIGIAGPPRLAEEQRQRAACRAEQSGAEQMEDVADMKQISGRARRRHRAPAPGKAREHRRGDSERRPTGRAGGPCRQRTGRRGRTRAARRGRSATANPLPNRVRVSTTGTAP